MYSWKRVSPFGILVDGSKDAGDSGSPWHSARLFDMLRVGGVASGPLLCASPLSGIWLVSPLGGPAIPLSWDRWGGSPPDFPDVWNGLIPNVLCLAQGIHSPEHVYAGGGSFNNPVGSHAALSETDVTQPAPLFHWRSIPVADANLQALDTGVINRIVVVSQLHKLVLACDKGVFWAQIPPPGGTYIFQQAMGLPAGARFSGLALAQGANVIAGAWGTDLGNADPANPHAGIFVGRWIGGVGPLNFQRASVPSFLLTRRIDIAGTPANPMLLYAICGGGNPSTPKKDKAGKFILDPFNNVTWTDDKDVIRFVLRSNDGGFTWLKMDRVILALLEYGRVEAAATALGVSPVTVYRMMKTPTFEAEFREARRNAFSRWITRLQHAAPAAVAVLFQIMADRGAPPAIRVRAAEIVLDHAASTFVLEDLDVRLDRLERADEKPPSESNMLEDAGDGTESKK